MINVEGYLEYRGDVQLLWGDIMRTVGDIIFYYLSTSTVLNTSRGYHLLLFEYHWGYHDTCRGYHEYRGGV